MEGLHKGEWEEEGEGRREQEQQQDIELGSMLAAAHFHIHRLFIGHPHHQPGQRSYHAIS